MDPFTLITDRLVLRRFEPEDLDAVLAYAADEELGRYLPVLPHPYLREHAEAFLSTAIGCDWARAPCLALTLEGRVIGAIDLNVEDGTAALGYALGRDWWGHGLATEAARAAVDCAFDRYGVEVVWATTDARNAASRRVLEKVGMHLDGTLRQRRVHRGERHDECHYSILRSEWEQAR